ncbi:hypothetical protein FSP39_023121 [Pinctada imbricata]|uniref:BTB domain-containing protein n=1 Tax=Pinctada imbricata TaxID=66713 RepID=A0AA88XU81_PINIB|nr:hypothetical protein FSP39_023121 [Pinctada imbricata]
MREFSVSPRGRNANAGDEVQTRESPAKCGRVDSACTSTRIDIPTGMGNKLSSAVADKFSNKKTEDKRGEKRKRRDSDREDGEGRETPPPSSSKGLAPHSDIHTPKRKKLLSTTKYIYQTLFLDGENSDIKIYALGQEWKLHKVYLSQSPFFACMFNGSWREALQTEIDLDIPDPAIDIKSLRTAFGSLYRDYVFIKPIDVVGVFAAANLLQLEGLIQQCLTMMSNSIRLVNSNFNLNTVCSYYDASLRYDIDSVKMECYNWLLTNLLIVPDVELLKQISIPLMKNLVSASELFVMQVEMDIYSLLKKWMFLQMKKSWTGSDKDLLEDVETYYKTATSECVFLESSEGRQFIPAFQGLRWQHIVTDLTSLKVLEKDKIIKIDRLNPLFQHVWRRMLNVEHGADHGPSEVPESVEFSKTSLRCGRILKTEGEYCWRWVGYQYGIDVLLTYVNKLITMKRNTLSQASPGSVSMKPNRNIVYRLRIMNRDKKGKITLLRTTGMKLEVLKKDEEVLLMTLDSQVSFPLYLSMDLMLLSPETSMPPLLTIPDLLSTINTDVSDLKTESSTQTDMPEMNDTASQTDPLFSLVTNVSGGEADISYQLGTDSRSQNQSFKITSVADPPQSERSSKSDLELIHRSADLSMTLQQGTEDKT